MWDGGLHGAQHGTDATAATAWRPASSVRCPDAACAAACSVETQLLSASPGLAGEGVSPGGCGVGLEHISTGQEDLT